MKCAYCSGLGPFNDEHVLTRALYGPGNNWVLKDTVCEECNSRFSRYERRWLSEPGLSYARIMHGPLGRTRTGITFAAHPSENWFLKANCDPIFYEVDVLPQMQGRLRVQCVGTASNVVFIAGDHSDLSRFKTTYDAFVKNPEITLQKRLRKGDHQYRIATLDLGSPVRISRVTFQNKPALAWVDRFPTDTQSSMPIQRNPRMSVDPAGRLRFRVTRIADIPALLNRMFAQANFTSPGGSFHAGTYQLINREAVEISPSSFSFRAVAKTLVNYAISELGTEWISSPRFQPILHFCVFGTIPEGHVFVDLVSDALAPHAVRQVPVERHAITLLSDGSHVAGFLRLYKGPVYRVRLGEALPQETFEHSIYIDYNGVGVVSPADNP